MIERELGRPGPAQDVDQGERRDGRRRRRPTRHRSRRPGRPAAGVPVGRPLRPASPSAARAAASRRPDAVAGRVGPRRDPQLAQPIAKAVAVRRPGRPCRDPVDGVVVGVRRAPAPPRARSRASRPRRARPATGPGTRSGARVEADLDDVDPPVEHVGEGRRGRTERPPGIVGRKGERRSAGRGGRRHRRRPARPRPSRTRPSRSDDVTKRVAAARPCRRPGPRTARGVDAAAAATSAPSSPSARRSSAAGGSPAPARIASTRESSRRLDISSGSVGLGARRRHAPAAPRCRGHERPERPFRSGHHGQQTRRVAGNLHPRELGDGRSVETERGSDLGIGARSSAPRAAPPGPADRPPRARRASQPAATDPPPARSAPPRSSPRRDQTSETPEARCSRPQATSATSGIGTEPSAGADVRGEGAG